MVIVTAVATLGGLTLALASLLVLASRRLHVPEDPRIDVVEAMLPHANCGACGYPGCRPFAEALVAGSAAPAGCTVSSDAGRRQIAAYLGIAVGQAEKRVARLACAGGDNVARWKARYLGPTTCRAASQVAGGGKACVWGCLGYGDCAVACTFDAIRLDAHRLPVVDEARCTACGDCVEACPKDLFSIHPASHRLWVACRSREVGEQVLDDCEVACTACGRCAADAPGLITMQDGLPVVDYTRPHATQAPIARCPTGAIVWLDPHHGPLKGPAARPVVRRGVRPAAPS